MNKKIEIIIFSYNRAMQLNTLINSILKYFPEPFHITVLYNHTIAHQKGYEILQKKFTNIKFIQEDSSHTSFPIQKLFKLFNFKRYLKYKYLRKPRTDFRHKLISILKDSDSAFTMFLTDDSVFIKPVELNPILLERISENPKDLQYSLRLGENINSPASYSKNGNFMIWDFSIPENKRDWRYNFSVDAHIYDTKFILDMSKDIIFNNPNTYESFTKIRICEKGYQNYGVANLTPSILSFPINMVQDVQGNESLDVSTEQLEKYFIDGYSLKYDIPENIDTFQYYPKVLTLEKDGEVIRINTNFK